MIKSSVLPYISGLYPGEKILLDLSSGMNILLPSVKIGIKVGNITINEVVALVVDDGVHDIILGSSVIEKAFNVNAYNEPGVSAASPYRSDSDATTIELYSVSGRYYARQFEIFLNCTRRLYNVMLVSNRFVPANKSSINDLIMHDKGVAANLILEIMSVENGSIILTLKSGALKALELVANIFDKSATAALAKEVAESKKANIDAKISEETRRGLVDKINEENSTLTLDNIKKRHDLWRSEIKARIKVTDEIINSISDKNLANELRKERDEAVSLMLRQDIFPLVRHVTGGLTVGKSDFLALPSPDSK